MAKTKIVWDEAALRRIAHLPEIVATIQEEADKVAAYAAATAQEAQGGPGGTLAGYAEAGFTVDMLMEKDKPQARIYSNADKNMLLRVYFYSQKLWGVTHLRRALYKYSNRGI